MVSNLIYFIHLIQYTVINILIIKNKYFRNIMTYNISYLDWCLMVSLWFSVDVAHSFRKGWVLHIYTIA